VLEHSSEGFPVIDCAEFHVSETALIEIADMIRKSGERRVRCLNMSFAVTSLIGNVFRFADLDATVTLFLKEYKTLLLRSVKLFRMSLRGLLPI
jgi:hypothetical protein